MCNRCNVDRSNVYPPPVHSVNKVSTLSCFVERTKSPEQAESENFPVSFVFSHVDSLWQTMGGFRYVRGTADVTCTAGLFKEFDAGKSVRIGFSGGALYHASFLDTSAFFHDILAVASMRLKILPSGTGLYIFGGAGCTGTHVYALSGHAKPPYELATCVTVSLEQEIGERFALSMGISSGDFFEYNYFIMPRLFAEARLNVGKFDFVLESSRYYTAFGAQRNAHTRKTTVKFGVEYAL